MVDFVLRFFWIIIYAIKEVYDGTAASILENLAIFLEVTRYFLYVESIMIKCVKI